MFLALGMAGLMCRFWVLKSPKIGVFLPLKFLGGTYEHPYMIKYFRTHRVVWQSFAKIGPGMSKNLWWEKRKLNNVTKIKQSSLSLSRATVIMKVLNPEWWAVFNVTHHTAFQRRVFPDNQLHWSEHTLPSFFIIHLILVMTAVCRNVLHRCSPKI